MLRELQQHLLAVNGRVSGSIESHLSGDKYSVMIYGFIVDEAHCIRLHSASLEDLGGLAISFAE